MVQKKRSLNTDKLSSRETAAESENTRLAHHEAKRRRLRRAKRLGLYRDCKSRQFMDKYAARIAPEGAVDPAGNATPSNSWRGKLRTHRSCPVVPQAPTIVRPAHTLPF